MFDSLPRISPLLPAGPTRLSLIFVAPQHLEKHSISGSLLKFFLRSEGITCSDSFLFHFKLFLDLNTIIPC